MSRNSRRARAPQHPEKETSTERREIEPKQQKNIEHKSHIGLPFVSSTETVFLPSGGSFYDNNSALYGVDSVEINSMTAREEDIITNDNYIQQGVVFEKLIDSLMITPGIEAKDLLDCDKLAILVSARKTGYGDEVVFDTICDSCEGEFEAKVKLSNILNNIEAKRFKIESSEGLEYNPESKTIEFVLPVTNVQAQIRLLTPQDRDYLKQTKKQKEKLKLPFSETIEFLRLALVSANGITDSTSLFDFIDVLPSSDARRIKIVHNKNIPALDTTQEIECTNCSEISEKEVPFSLGWFWSD